MRRALELARHGEGCVEPNPMVGCVIVRDGEIVGEGYHARFGGDHAEVVALKQAGERARTATLYVTLEPCSHFGKTPPCADAIVRAGVRRVVLAHLDPFPLVAGDGIRRLRENGIEVEIGLLGNLAEELNAPFIHLIRHGRPWVIAKWAMSLDGKIATHSGDSRWISNERSRAIVHELRSRMDAIVVGRRTVERDDPLLTVRLATSTIESRPCTRTPMRVVITNRAEIADRCRLVQTARDVPVLIFASADAPPANVERLQRAGCEVWQSSEPTPLARLRQYFAELGRRRFTNILVEGGAALLGGLFDEQLVNEAHIFLAPKVIGGESGTSAVGGAGIDRIGDARTLKSPKIVQLDDNVYISGRFS